MSDETAHSDKQIYEDYWIFANFYDVTLHSFPAKHLPGGVALDGRWSGIGWEGEAFCPHLPSSPATEHPVMYLLREGVSLEGRQQPGCGSACRENVSLDDAQWQTVWQTFVMAATLGRCFAGRPAAAGLWKCLPGKCFAG